VTASEPRDQKARPRDGRRLFVLDTNVLMHDPTSIFRFEEHDVYLPMVVLEELDAHKKGLSEASRNVRQVSRFLDEMMRGVTKEQIDRGLQLPSGYSGNHGKKPSTGRLYFQTRELDSTLPAGLPGKAADNSILGQTLGLQNERPDVRVILLQRQDTRGFRCPVPRDVLPTPGLLGAAWNQHALLEGRRSDLLRSLGA
jgi:PhoH-like ATPase